MKYVLKNCNMYSGKEKDDLITGVNIYIDDEIISNLDTNADTQAEYEILDCTDKYVIPGLINLHSHLFGSGKPSKNLNAGAKQQKLIKLAGTWLGKAILDKVVMKNMRNVLYSGCTTVRGMGDFFESDIRARDKINSGKAIGPRLKVSGFAITSPIGHGAGTFAITGETKAELEKCVDRIHSNNPDIIKICTTGGVMDAKVKGEPGEVKMTLSQVKAVCDQAHKYGYKVASHTESTKGMYVALEGGVDTIEHGAIIDEKLVELFKKNNASLTATFSPAIPFALLDPSITKMGDLQKYNAEVLLDQFVSGIKTALKEEIPVGMGTDASCPFAFQYNMWRELVYFTKYINCSNKFSIFTATLQNAKIIGCDDVTGSIEVGKFADIIIMDKNPIEDLNALRKLDAVIYKGQIHTKLKIKKNEEFEKILDNLC